MAYILNSGFTANNVIEIATASTPSTDEQILERALAGDADAFGEIVRRWERKIYHLAYGMLGRDEDARDATQETFMSAFKNLPGFRGDAKVSSWLHRIAINQCISRQRRARVRGETFLEEEGLEDGVGLYAAPGNGSPARVAESRERSEIVRRAVSALPEELREVLVLKEYEEMTFQEVAETLDLPLSTVKSRLYTALRQLRLRLAKYGEGIHVDDQRTSR